MHTAFGSWALNQLDYTATLNSGPASRDSEYTHWHWEGVGTVGGHPVWPAIAADSYLGSGAEVSASMICVITTIGYAYRSIK